ncbi:MAG: beta-lactamase family protein [Deltaproteobacteria bacterium]|nr:beta-lactamase family protein [Deltaproteobacteria bacterium]
MLRRSVILLALTAAACAKPDATASPVDPSPQPAAPEAEATPPAASSPFSPEAIESALAYSAQHSGHAVLIVHDGREVASAFQNGWEPTKPHPLASGTKSFWGPLAVAAVDDGLLTSLDERAAETITEWSDDPRRSQITVRQLLSLTAGLAPDLGVTIEQVPQADMFGLTVAAAAEHDPGAKWAYSDSGHTAVGVVLDRKLAAKGSSLERYVHERLLQPAGIETTDWQRDGAEHLLMPSGARLTPTQWAAYGEVIRTGGLAADGERVLSADQLAACFEPSAAPPAGQFYGLGWWLTSYTSFQYDLPHDMVIAGGSGGQYLFVIPSANLTIVRFGNSEDFVDGEFLCRLFHNTGREGCPTKGKPTE